MTSIYIDLECDHQNNIIEMGVIHTSEYQLQNQFHRLIDTRITDYRTIDYGLVATNSHCIPIKVLQTHGMSYKRAIEDLELFLVNIPRPFTIKGNGDDVAKDNLQRLFPFLKDWPDVAYKQVVPKRWIERQSAKSHVAAQNMKLGSELYCCGKKIHALNYIPQWQTKKMAPTQTQLAKLAYGHHCAMIDVYELAFLDDSLPCYTCDKEFAKNVNHIFLNYQDNDEISYNHLSVNDSMLFID